MTDTNFEVILRMLFLKINNTNISLNKKKLLWKFYITNKILFIIEQVLIVNLKKFVIAILNINGKIFIKYMVICK